MNRRSSQQVVPLFGKAAEEEVIRHYDAQSDEEHARELEAAEEVASWVRVPRALIPDVKALIKAHESRKAS